jgi:hypothetical protein
VELTRSRWITVLPGWRPALRFAHALPDTGLAGPELAAMEGSRCDPLAHRSIPGAFLRAPLRLVAAWAAGA